MDSDTNAYRRLDRDIERGDYDRRRVFGAFVPRQTYERLFWAIVIAASALIAWLIA